MPSSLLAWGDIERCHSALRAPLGGDNFGFVAMCWPDCVTGSQLRTLASFTGQRQHPTLEPFSCFPGVAQQHERLCDNLDFTACIFCRNPEVLALQQK